MQGCGMHGAGQHDAHERGGGAHPQAMRAHVKHAEPGVVAWRLVGAQPSHVAAGGVGNPLGTWSCTSTVLSIAYQK